MSRKLKTKISNSAFLIFIIMSIYSLANSQKPNVTLNNSIPAGPKNLTNSTNDCLIGSYDSVIGIIQKQIEKYSNLLKPESKSELADLFEVAKLNGLVIQKFSAEKEKFNSTDYRSKYSNFKSKLSSADSMAEILKKPTSESALKEAARQVYKDLENISKLKNYPNFFTANLMTFLNYIKNLAYFTSFSDKSACVPLKKLTAVERAINDPMEEGIITKQSVKMNTDSYKISPMDFESSGISFSFFSVIDPVASGSRIVMQGYYNNEAKIQYQILDGANTTQSSTQKSAGSFTHRFTINKQQVDIAFKTSCTDVIFTLFSINRDVDKYKLMITLHSLITNSKQKVDILLSNEVVEGLTLNYLQPWVKEPYIFSSWVQSQDNYAKLFTAMFKTSLTFLLPLIEACYTDDRCLYFSSVNKQCSLCKEGSALFEGKCNAECPQFTFRFDKTTCKLCDGNCDKCKSDSNCTNCQSGFYKIYLEKTTSKCVKSCTEYKGYFESSSSQGVNKLECKKCSDNCSTCASASKCQTCLPHYFLLNGACVEKCPKGTFEDYTSKRTCKNCNVYCVRCINSEVCSECLPKFFFKDGNCLSKCGNGYFADFASKCKPCMANCKTCLNSKGCKECSEGFTFDSKLKKCSNICKCAQVQYSSNTCVQCSDRNCDGCNPINPSTCWQCTTGFANSNGKCVSSCGPGFFINKSNVCSPCFEGCSVCDKDRKCKQCVSNMLLLNDSYCYGPSCPDGFFTSGRTCLKCKTKSCKKCPNSSNGNDLPSESCTECYPGDFLKEGKCVSECGTRYLQKDGKCVKCSEGCAICNVNEEICDVCLPNFYKKENACVNNCQNGFRKGSENLITNTNYKNNTTSIVNTVNSLKCEKCLVTNCDSCVSDATQCGKCKSPKVLYNNACYSQCPLGTFLTKDMKCQLCSSNCDVCENAVTCKKCATPKLLLNGKCVDDCGDSYRSNSINTCEVCLNPNCKKCSSNANECSECPTGKVLHLNDCKQDCPANTYKDRLSPTTIGCSKCSQLCTKCLDSSTCSECITGYNLNKNSTCSDDCKDGFVRIKGKNCTKCEDQGCLKCDANNPTTCLQCGSGLVLFNADCLDKCPEGYYQKNGECLACGNGCVTCDPANPSNCLTCRPNLFLKDTSTANEGKQCVNDCGSNWTNDGVSNGSGKCFQCLNNCQSCLAKNLGVCTKCPSQLFLLDGKCHDACPEKTYSQLIDSDTKVCKPCTVDNCVKCPTFSGSICDKCAVDFFLMDGKCVDKCPNGYRENPSGVGRCDKCQVQDCSKCNSNGECLQCKDTFVLIDKLTCSSSCPLGKFKVDTVKSPVYKPAECLDCTPNCYSCTSINNCTKCRSNFYMHGNSCLESCPDFFRTNFDKCSPCEANCNKCSESSCIKCQAPFALQTNTCVTECGVGKYKELQQDKSSLVCKSCPLFCSSCDDSLNCKECATGKVLAGDNTCKDSCPDGSVSVGSKCVLCRAESCLKCSEKDVKKCLSCKDNKFLLDGLCIDKCPLNYYTDKNNLCQKCIENCETCHTSTTCENCSQNFSLMDGQCTSKCPTGYFSQNGKCRQCNENCAACSSPEKCTNCKDGYFKQEDRCVKTCEMGFFLFNNLICKKCTENCNDCDNTETCKNCIAKFKKLDGKCVNECPENGYYLSDNTCQKCKPGCTKCRDRVNCTQCSSTQFLKDGDCLENCGPGFFADKTVSSCKSCLLNCNSCDDSSNCIMCTNGFFYQENKRKCVQKCDDSNSANAINKKCEHCSVKDCKVCEKTNSCDECFSPFLKMKVKVENINSNSNSTASVYSCTNPDKCDISNSYFIDSDNRECKLCSDPNCQTCNSSNECKSCKKSFSLLNDKCVSSCGLGMTSIAGNCTKCTVAKCEVCSDVNDCTKCKDEMKINMNKIISGNSTSTANNVTCVDQCPLKKYSSLTKCLDCPSDCRKCSEGSSCSECDASFLLKEGKCVTACGDNYTERNKKCVKCSNTQCLQCDSVNPENCKKCGNGFKLYKGNCVASCPARSYPVEVEDSTSCHDCTDSNCEECSNEGSCKTCLSPFLKLNNKCITECPVNFSPDNNRNCEKCLDSNCKACLGSSPDKCKECTADYFLNKDARCINACPPKTYFRISPSKACIDCNDPKCIACAPEDSCDRCESTLLTFKGRCVESCPVGFYSDSSDVCRKCEADNCSKCKATDSTICEECNSDRLLFKGKCVDKCTKGYYARVMGNSITNSPSLPQLQNQVTNSTVMANRNECLPCDPKCQECDNRLQCVTCLSPYLLDGNKTCVDQCPGGSVKSNNTTQAKCELCVSKDCLKCKSDNLSQCLECKSSFYLYNSTCVKDCDLNDGKYLMSSTRTCYDCEKNCKKCQDGSTCLECYPPLVEDKSGCVKDCRLGWTNVNGHCRPCKDANCDKCKTDLTFCSSCVKPFKSDGGNCVPNCDYFQFFDEIKKECQNCTENCHNCKNSFSCERCAAGYFLDRTSANSTCVDKCNDGFFPEEGQCKPCKNRNCKMCSFSDSTSCTLCDKTKFLFNNDCVNMCPKGYTPIGEKCSVVAPQPDQNCPAGQVLRNSECLKCVDPNCEKCTSYDLNKCQECTSSTILYNDNCISKCPKGMFLDIINFSCIKCSGNCDECINLHECTQCSAETYLRDPLSVIFINVQNTNQMDANTNSSLKVSHAMRNNSFISLEVEKQFVNFLDGADDLPLSEYGLNQCNPCRAPDLTVSYNETTYCTTCKVPGCFQCENSNDSQCKFCESKFILHKGECVITCPIGYFKSGSQCLPCSSNCTDCLASTVCRQCAPGLNLHLDSCVSSCPDNYLSINSKCQNCASSQCLKCTSALNVCLTCDAKSLLYNGQCLEKCPPKFFENNSKCESCSDNCLKCDKSSCRECQSGFKIKSNKCVAEGSCGLSYFESASECVACSDSNCLQCSPQNVCTKCKESSYLLNGSCVSSCPDGTSRNEATRKCELCDSGCEKCSEKTKCFSCLNGYKLYENKCWSACPANTTSLKDTCVKCMQSDCEQCLPENPDKCLKCKTKLFADNCFTSCPVGTYSTPDGAACAQCDSKCLDCESKSKCRKCKPEFAFADYTCENGCPDGKVNINGVCLDCASDKCKECSTDVNVCLSCKKGWRLFNNDCLGECPTGYVGLKEGSCKKCEEGCADCKLQTDNTKYNITETSKPSNSTIVETCNSCNAGWFLSNSTCVINCGKGFYGECQDRKCKKCDDSCSECVDKSNSDCTKCNTNYFRMEKACVKPSDCPYRTFADEKTGKCLTCKLPYCEQCIDGTKCSVCSRGFVLDKSGQCKVGQTFTNFLDSPVIFDSYNYFSKKSVLRSEVTTGINSPHVSFSFWLRVLGRNMNNKLDTSVLALTNAEDLHTMNININYNHLTSSLILLVTNKFTNQVQKVLLNLPDKKSNPPFNYYDWTFLAFSIDRDIGSEDYYTLTLRSMKENSTFSESKVSLILTSGLKQVISKNSQIAIYDDQSRDSLEISGLNLLDYHPTDEDLTLFAKTQPGDCDYFCKTCAGKCVTCQDGSKSIEGYCPAVPSYINKGLYLAAKSDSKLSFDLAALDKVTVSERWAMSTWFYYDNLNSFDLYSDKFVKSTNSTDSTNLYNNRLVVDNGRFKINNTTISDVIVKANNWYFVMMGMSSERSTTNNVNDKLINGNSIKFYIYSHTDNKYLYNASLSLAVPRLWNSYEFNLNATSLFDSAVYINNIPDESTLKTTISDFPCPNNCLQCGKLLTCEICKSGYKISSDGSCSVKTPAKSSRLVKRINVWDNSTLAEVNANDYPQLSEWALSFWIRKKTHLGRNSSDTKEVTILSLLDNQNTPTPLLREVTNADMSSDFVLGDKSNRTLFSVPSDTVYDYLFLMLSFNNATNELFYSTKDYSRNKTERGRVGLNKLPANKASNITNNNTENKISFPALFTKFRFGDSSNEESNIEISNFDIYNNGLTEEDVTSIRDKLKPKDCDSGCKSGCDLETGLCDSCSKAATCSAQLVGYNNVYIYAPNNPLYNSLANKDIYINSLVSNGYTVSTNSLGYSVLGYLNVFDFRNVKNRTLTRERVLSVSNKKNRFYTEDWGKNLFALNILVNNTNSSTLELLVNTGKEGTKSFPIPNLAVTVDQWIAFHIGVDILTKTLTYNFINNQNKKNTTGSIALTGFLEKLQERAVISALGVNDNLDSNLDYIVPSVRLQSVFLVNNKGYSLDLFNKYLGKYLPPVDPTCDVGCKKCLPTAKKNVTECLECLSGFTISNSLCQPSKGYKDYSYQLLTDGIVTKSTNFEIKLKELFTGNNPSLATNSFTLGFYLRRNYFTSQDTILLQVGGISLTLQSSVYALGDQISLKYGGEVGPSLYLENSNSNSTLSMLSDWTNIQINYSKGKISLSFTDVDGNTSKKTTNLDSQLLLSSQLNDLFKISKVSLSSFGSDLQFYGLYLANADLNGAAIESPQLDCSIDCGFCKANMCKSCLYGATESGCKSRSIRLAESKGGSVIQLSDYIPKLNYRSINYTLLLVLKPSTKADETIQLFGFDNAKDRTDLINVKMTPNKTFLISLTNRWIKTKYQTSEYVEVKLPSANFKSSQLFVGISLSGSELTYLIFNDKNNFASGKYVVEGEMDYVTVDGKLIVDKSTSYVRDVKYYYETALNADSLLSKAKKYANLVQDTCDLGSSEKCDKCSDKNSYLSNNLCVANWNPDDKGVSMLPLLDPIIIPDILSISRWSKFDTVNQSKEKKFPLKGLLSNTSNKLTKLSLFFWWRMTGMINSKQGIARISLTSDFDLSIYFTPSENKLYTELNSKNTKMQVKSVLEFKKVEEVYEWTLFKLTIDFKNVVSGGGSPGMRVSLTNEPSKRAEVDVKDWDSTKNAGFSDIKLSEFVTVSLGYEDSVQGINDNTSFEVVNMMLYLNRDLPKEYEAKMPYPSHTPCKNNPAEICEKENLIFKTLTIGSSLSPSTSSTSNLLKQTPLFIPAYYSASYNQSFRQYLISFSIDVGSFLKSDYTANKNTLLVITNESNKNLDLLSIEDIIPSVVISNSIVSVVNDNGTLKVTNGFLPWNNVLSTFSLPLGGRKIDSFKNIYISMQFLIGDRSIRSIVIADDLVFTTNSNDVSLSGPLSFYSQVFKHPAIDKVNLNLHNPRLDYDINENAQNMFSANINSTTCSTYDSRCKSCLIPENTKEVFCFKCKDGYKFDDGNCKSEISKPTS